MNSKIRKVCNLGIEGPRKQEEAENQNKPTTNKKPRDNQIRTPNEEDEINRTEVQTVATNHFSGWCN
jgi:hypothetical protein